MKRIIQLLMCGMASVFNIAAQERPYLFDQTYGTTKDARQPGSIGLVPEKRDPAKSGPQTIMPPFRYPLKYMEQVDMDGIRVMPEKPVLIATNQPGEKAWFSRLLQFPGGELMVGFSCIGDTHEKQAGISYAISTDMGGTWTRGRLDEVFMNFAGMGDESDNAMILMGLPLTVGPRDKWLEIISENNEKTEVAVTGLKVVFSDGELKADGPISQRVVVPGSWVLAYWHGPIMRMPDGALLTMLECYDRKADGADRASIGRGSVLAMRSTDEGRTWEYYSTAASSKDASGYEGPDENSFARLSDGRLLCVYRTQGERGPYWHSFSADDGKTWSKPEPMNGPYAVMPRLVRMGNGVLALSGGRPGVFLWLSADDGRTWQQFDVMRHHNSFMPEHTHFEGGRTAGNMIWAATYCTTAYTGLLEIEDGVLLLTYDRVPYGWSFTPAGAFDNDMVFALRLRVEKQDGLKAQPIPAATPAEIEEYVRRKCDQLKRDDWAEHASGWLERRDAAIGLGKAALSFAWAAPAEPLPEFMREGIAGLIELLGREDEHPAVIREAGIAMGLAGLKALDVKPAPGSDADIALALGDDNRSWAEMALIKALKLYTIPYAQTGLAIGLGLIGAGSEDANEAVARLAGSPDAELRAAAETALRRMRVLMRYPELPGK